MAMILGKTTNIRTFTATWPNIHLLGAPFIPSGIAHIGKIRNLVSPLESRALRTKDRHSNESLELLRAADRPRKLESAFPVKEPTFELGLLYGQQDFPESGPRDKAHALEIISCDQLRGIHFFGRSFH
jgi:hypothetical protein